ncbi:unnamed protein product, partial [Discosporangium mesarthrocarpum]
MDIEEAARKGDDGMDMGLAEKSEGTGAGNPARDIAAEEGAEAGTLEVKEGSGVEVGSQETRGGPGAESMVTASARAGGCAWEGERAGGEGVVQGGAGPEAPLDGVGAPADLATQRGGQNG